MYIYILVGEPTKFCVGSNIASAVYRGRGNLSNDFSFHGMVEVWMEGGKGEEIERR